jgi:hypothetical protein
LRLCHTHFVYFIFLVHPSHYIHTTYLLLICRHSPTSPHRQSVQWEKPPWGAEPRIESGLLLLYAEALPGTNWPTPHPIDLRHTLMSYAAP